jgi:hypothetical protein
MHFRNGPREAILFVTKFNRQLSLVEKTMDDDASPSYLDLIEDSFMLAHSELLPW